MVFIFYYYSKIFASLSIDISLFHLLQQFIIINNAGGVRFYELNLIAHMNGVAFDAHILSSFFIIFFLFFSRSVVDNEEEN